MTTPTSPRDAAALLKSAHDLLENVARASDVPDHKQQDEEFLRGSVNLANSYAKSALGCLSSALSAPPAGMVLVPEEPTEAMLEAALDESGQRCEAFTAPRESGVPTECDMSDEDARYINEQCKAAHGDTYRAMLRAAPEDSEGK